MKEEGSSQQQALVGEVKRRKEEKAKLRLGLPAASSSKPKVAESRALFEDEYRIEVTDYMHQMEVSPSPLLFLIFFLSFIVVGVVLISHCAFAGSDTVLG